MAPNTTVTTAGSVWLLWGRKAVGTRLPSGPEAGLGQNMKETMHCLSVGKTGKAYQSHSIQVAS